MKGQFDGRLLIVDSPIVCSVSWGLSFTCSYKKKHQLHFWKPGSLLNKMGQNGYPIKMLCRHSMSSTDKEVYINLFNLQTRAEAKLSCFLGGSKRHNSKWGLTCEEQQKLTILLANCFVPWKLGVHHFWSGSSSEKSKLTMCLGTGGRQPFSHRQVPPNSSGRSSVSK